MVQYQSFPDASGDSRTLDKLKALRLPDLAGRNFLDVGCNEGFFCGFAKFQGAARSVGIDSSRTFIERARRRFPDCEFSHQHWDALPAGPFDTILLASALHYAQDQEEFIHRLVGQLSADGVLILELGIVAALRSDWIMVQRGADQRLFPTMAKLREVLGGYAWKWMGPSVSQDGDPVSRHVIHVSRRRPVAYLLMQPPAHGKTSIAAHLFGPANVSIISGDQQINLLAQGKLEASAELMRVVRSCYSPFQIDQTIQRIFDAGLGNDLVHFLASGAEGRDFAVDAYVPAEWQAMVKKAVLGLGYLPVTLHWERSDLGLLPSAGIDEQADAFYLSLSAATSDRALATTTKREHLTGYVDEVSCVGNKLIIRGWAMTSTGMLPASLAVFLDGKPVKVEKFEKLLRADVQKHMGLPHALVGYRLQADVSHLGDDPRGIISVSGSGRLGSTLHIGQNIDKRWIRK